MSGSLEGPQAKVGRAVEHYRTLKDDFHGGFDHKRRAVTSEPHRDGLEYRFRVGKVEPIDPAMALVLGDAYYNLRSALDQLVFQLHVRRYRGKVPKDAEEESAFPIWEKSWGRPTSQWREIKRLGRPERTKIEWLQPYHGVDDTTWPRPKTFIGQLRLGLRDLNELNVIDKHRQLHLCNYMPTAVPVPSFLIPYGVRQEPRFGVPLETDAYVDTWHFDTPPPVEKVNVHPGVLTGISLDVGRPKWLDVLPHLSGLIIVVASVIARFERLFPPSGLGRLDLSNVWPVDEPISTVVPTHRTVPWPGSLSDISP